MDLRPTSEKIQLFEYETRKRTMQSEHRQDVYERSIYFIGGLLISLLAVRFFFALLGANPNNGIAAWIYGVTAPLVAPFFNLFNYNFTVGIVRFESYTLAAIMFYGLICYGFAHLATINRHL